MGKEFELKYQASPEVLEKILKKFCGFSPITMETHYYDTPSGELGARRWTLRRRIENGVSVCGLKTPGKDRVRGEWEVENSSMKNGILELCKLDVPEEFPVIAAGELVEVCAAAFTRLAKRYTYKDCTVEIALDQGFFLGNNKKRPFSELEIELKEGNIETAALFAQALAAEYHLSEGHLSKFERALALAGGK